MTQGEVLLRPDGLLKTFDPARENDRHLPPLFCFAWRLDKDDNFGQRLRCLDVDEASSNLLRSSLGFLGLRGGPDGEED